MQTLWNIIKAAIWTVVGVFGLLYWSALFYHAYGSEIVQLREVNIEYKDFLPGGSDPLITQNGLPNRTLGKELNLNLNSNVLTYFFWDNKVHSMTDEIVGSGGKGQFRAVGWNFKLGVRATSWLDIQYEHFSKHILDHEYVHGRFPVQDSVGIRLHLYQLKKADSVF